MSLRNFTDVRSVVLQQVHLFNTKLTGKIKGTFVEKWMKYWNHLGRDYRDVALSVKAEAKQKPMKAASYITGLGFLYFCNTHNPNLQSFRANYLQCANDLGLIHEDLVNPQSMNHMKYIEECYNTRRLRYLNLGIASVIWVDNYSKECNLYESNCKYLKVPYSKFKERIIDIGFCNIWWVMSRKMLDYDVNYE